MRVVVIGMLNKYKDMIGTHPYLDIRFFNEAAKHATGSEQLAANADRILLMRNFITHSIQDKMSPHRHKVTLVRGGVTRLREQLDLLNSTAKMAHIDSVLYPEDDMSSFNFVQLQTAASGDVFEYHKPKNLPGEKFKMMMHQGRSYVKRMHGVLSEQEIVGGGNKCNIMVTGRVSEESKIAVAKEHIPVVAPKVAVAPNRSAQQFWRDVFKHSLSLRPSAPTKEHSDCANYAVDAWTSKFGGAP